MNDNDCIEIALNYLNHKGIFTDLGKDLLSTINKYNERPFDRNGSIQKVQENNLSYPELFIRVSAQPGIVNKPFNSATDMEIHNNLYLQIQAMCEKVMSCVDDKIV